MEAKPFLYRRQTSDVWESREQPFPQQDVPQHDRSIVHKSSVNVMLHRTRKATGSRNLWLLECLSCLLATATLIATAITLNILTDKPLPNWPYLISINSLVAVLSSIFKAAILFPVTECLSELKWVWFSIPRPASDFDHFDSASRSPWGSFKLFFKFPTNFLAILGAAITIVSLAIDPFTQQIIQYKGCITTEPGIAANVQRTHNFTSAGALISSALSGPGTWALDAPTTAAIYQGLITPSTNATSGLAFTCPSGNCTFSQPDAFAYRSLAMCTSVQDITGSIIGTNPSVKTGNDSYNFTLPSGLNLNETKLPLLTASVAPEDEGGYYRSLFAFEALMLNNNSRSDKLVFASAFRVTITPCVHEYAGVNVLFNELQETIRSTKLLVLNSWLEYARGIPNYSIVGDLPAFPGVDCTPSKSPQGPKTIPSLTFTDGTGYVNRTDTALAEDSILFYDPSCAYEYAANSENALSKTLLGFFNNRYLTISGFGFGSNIIGDIWLQNLYHNGTANLSTVTNAMGGLANALTATMRSHGDAKNSQPATGTVLFTRTCVGVRWSWLALPASLLCLTLVLLVGTAIRSHKSTHSGGSSEGRMPWKSSLLPLLWCGLQDATRRRYPTFNDVRNMKRNSDDLVVSLRRAGDWGVEGQQKDFGGQGRWTLKEE